MSAPDPPGLAAAPAQASPTLTVRGGAGGTAARLDDLDAAGARLAEAARTMSWIAVRVARIAAVPMPAETLARSPITWWQAERSLVRALAGRSGAVVVAARYAALSTGASAAAATYRAADATADAAVHAADTAAGEAVGRFLAVPALAAAVTVAPALVVGGRPVSGTWLLDGLGGQADGVEHVADAAPGVMRGALSWSPLLAVLAAAVSGRSQIPSDVAGAAGWVGSVGRALPWLRESTQVTVRCAPATAVQPPRGVADLLRGIGGLDSRSGVPGGTVRVVAVTGAGGRRAWVVQIPGTQSWSPRAGRNPLDLTGNVHNLAGERTASQQVVIAALTAAGARSDEPVLLAGHSQGGIVAAQLAADPRFRQAFHVTHVVTAGSPVAEVAIPDSVSVLSLEHDHDLVPRLDGAPNPDRSGWITVGALAEPVGAPADAAGSHDVGAYARTATVVDASPDPGLARWRAGLAPYLAGEGVIGTQVLVTGERRPAA